MGSNAREDNARAQCKTREERRKFFLHTVKDRLADPSEICALEFKGEFRRFAICSVSGTIGINRPIFDIRNPRTTISLTATCNNGGAAWRWRIESGGRLRLPSCKGSCLGLT